MPVAGLNIACPVPESMSVNDGQRVINFLAHQLIAMAL